MKKKWISLFLAVLMVLGLTACGEDPDAKKYALITNPKTEETSYYSDLAWEGIEKFANEQGVKCGNYSSAGMDTEKITEKIDEAVDAGAEVIFCIGDEMSVAVYEAQKEHKKVKFYLMEAEPHKEGKEKVSIRENTCVIQFDLVQEGFLAGYAAVANGARSIGFMAGEETERNGKLLSGYLQGAEAAAKDGGLSAGEVTFRQLYTGADKLSPEYMAAAIEWYKAGCEVIFTPDENVAVSVSKAAENQDKKIICADDKMPENTASILTSTRKDYAGAAYQALSDFINDTFVGEMAVTYGAKENGVSLVMENASFTGFPMEKYDSMYQALANGTLRVAETAPATTYVVMAAE